MHGAVGRSVDTAGIVAGRRLYLQGDRGGVFSGSAGWVGEKGSTDFDAGADLRTDHRLDLFWDIHRSHALRSPRGG